MNRIKRFYIAQSTVELTVMIILSLVAITVMGPYVVRSINAYMRSWELQAEQGQAGINVGGLPWIEPPPVLTCADVTCSSYGSPEECNDTLPENCCLWVKRFKYVSNDDYCVCDQDSCVVRQDAQQGQNCPGGFCCGGDGFFSPGEGDGWCDDKWNCQEPEDPCENCDGGVCNYACRDVPKNSGETAESCDCPDCIPDSPYYTGYDPCDCQTDPSDCDNCPGCLCGDSYCRSSESGASCAFDCNPCFGVNCSAISDPDTCNSQMSVPPYSRPCCNWVVFCSSSGSDCFCGNGPPGGYCQETTGCPSGYHPGGIPWPGCCNGNQEWLQNCMQMVPSNPAPCPSPPFQYWVPNGKCTLCTPN